MPIIQPLPFLLAVRVRLAGGRRLCASTGGRRARGWAGGGDGCVWCSNRPPRRLVAARKLATSGEILLWMTPSEAPKALQASECSELLDPMRASCWISAQH